MASVNEIINRLEREDPRYGVFRPGLAEASTREIQAVEPENGGRMEKWLPNRKVVAGLVAGLITLAATKLGLDLGEDVTSALVVLVMSVVSYLVPLPEAPAEEPAER